MRTQFLDHALRLTKVATRVSKALASTGSDAVASARARLNAALAQEVEPPPTPPPPEPGRIYLAEKPHLLDRRGWGEVAIKIWEELFRDRLFLVAAGVAFFTMLAIFPALSVMVAIWSLFGDPQRFTDSIGDLAFILPPGGVDLLRNQAKLVADAGHQDLSLFIAGSMLISTWSANAGMKSMFEAMNIIYGEQEKRSFIALNIRSLLFTLGALAIFLATFLFLIAAPILLAWINWGQGSLLTLAIFRWPMLFAITVGFLTLLNRYGPSRPRHRARWSVWGSTLGAFMWLAVSVIFSFYVGHITNFAATYGSLAAIAGLMTWLWLSALVILIGIELNAELEHRTERWDEEQLRRLQVALPKPRNVAARVWRSLRRK